MQLQARRAWSNCRGWQEGGQELWYPLGHVRSDNLEWKDMVLSEAAGERMPEVVRGLVGILRR